jgi:type I restriction-modification system DNA methylase subunit
MQVVGHVSRQVRQDRFGNRARIEKAALFDACASEQNTQRVVHTDSQQPHSFAGTTEYVRTSERAETMNFIVNESAQKLRGGYYTPLDLATYITRWTLENNPRTLLEPSCGDGVFVQAFSEVGFSNSLSFTGFEILETEAAKARDRCQNQRRIQGSIARLRA